MQLFNACNTLDTCDIIKSGMDRDTFNATLGEAEWRCPAISVENPPSEFADPPSEHEMKLWRIALSSPERVNESGSIEASYNAFFSAFTENEQAMNRGWFSDAVFSPYNEVQSFDSAERLWSFHLYGNILVDGSLAPTPMLGLPGWHFVVAVGEAVDNAIIGKVAVTYKDSRKAFEIVGRSPIRYCRKAVFEFLNCVRESAFSS